MRHFGCGPFFYFHSQIVSVHIWLAVKLYLVAVIDITCSRQSTLWPSLIWLSWTNMWPSWFVAIIVLPLLQLCSRSSIWCCISVTQPVLSLGQYCQFFAGRNVPRLRLRTVLYRSRSSTDWSLRHISNYCHCIPVTVHDSSQAVQAGPSSACLMACLSLPAKGVREGRLTASVAVLLIARWL